MAKNPEMPVYLFTGFLESGKTKFIQETLEDKRFCNGEKTLLLVCEEGIEEYEPDQFADRSVFIREERISSTAFICGIFPSLRHWSATALRNACCVSILPRSPLG